MSEHVHIVKEGDALSELSKYYYRDMKYYPDLAKYNNIKNPDLITVGQKIKIPTYLMAGSETTEKGSTLNLVRVSSDKVKKDDTESTFDAVEIKSDIAIAFFFDGTGKNKEIDIPNRCESNVAKIFELFQQSKDENTGTEFQKKYYLHGVGTDSSNTLKNLPGLTVGFGGQNRISTAFEILGNFVKVHKDRKEIFIDIFGYSRGAALARHFVNVIHDFGIYDRDTQPIGKKTVTCHIDGRDHTTEIPIYPKYQNVTVRFLGLFDTVASFGLPGNDTNIGYSLAVHANRAKRIVHYTAKHEYRRNFDLTSIRRPLNETAPKAPESMSRFIATKPLPPHMEERFFIGSHGDVGGGTAQGNQGKSNELALIPLYAMVHEAIKAGVPLMSIDERKKSNPSRYEKAFKLPEELKPLEQGCYDWRSYAAMCDENTDYFKNIQKKYIHDSRLDGLSGGAFFDDGNTNRTVYYHGIY